MSAQPHTGRDRRGSRGPDRRRDSSRSAASLAAGAIEQALWRAFFDADTPAKYAQSWLNLQCSLIDGAVKGVVVMGEPDIGPYTPTAFWPVGISSGANLASIAEQALSDRRGIVQLHADEQAAAGTMAASGNMGYPLIFDGHLHGVVAIEIANCNEASLQAAMRMLQWGGSWLELLVRRQQGESDQAVRERLMTVLDLIAITLDQHSFQAAVSALTTELAQRLHCDRVTLGIAKWQKIKVVAVSHSAKFEKKMNLIDSIGLAMEEAMDQKTPIVFPPPADKDIFVTRDHAQLSRLHGNDHILSTPFLRASGFRGVLTYERPRGGEFQANEIELCESVASILGAILEERHLNDRPAYRKVWEYGLDQLRKVLGPRHLGRKLALIMLAAIFVFFEYATDEYRVTADSKLEGSVRRVIATPFPGFLATVNARAGDVVSAGDVLATLDESDTSLERMKWSSQREQYTRQYREAMAGHQRAEARILQAQIRQAEAQLALTDQQLARKLIIAPFDGVIVKGELYESLGASLQKGEVLFEITPLDAYRVILQVDERDVAEIATGQRGELVLSSITNQRFSFSVGTITPITTADEGSNFFRIEALLDDASDRLRPGMEGIAKIAIGERKVLWIWTHRLVDWVRLFFWKWLP